MKKGLLILGICAIVLCGCGIEKERKIVRSASNKITTTITEMFTESTTDELTENEAKKSIRDIYDNVVAQGKLSQLVELNDKYITDYYGIDVSKLEEYVFAQAESPKSADTLIIIKVKDMADMEEIKSGVQGIMNQKKIEMESYLPIEYNKVVNSHIVVNEDMMYLVIAANPDEISIN